MLAWALLGLLAVAACEEDPVTFNRALCDPEVWSVDPALGPAEGGIQVALTGLHLGTDGEDPRDVQVRVGGAAASIERIDRTGCDSCDACLAENACVDCARACEGIEPHGDAEAGLCTESVVFVAPAGPVGLAAITLATARGATTAGHFEYLAPCADGTDNDADGVVDGDDPGCSAGETETGPCEDGQDNDGDGWWDLADPDCDGTPAGPGETGFSDVACNDGVDDDGDGLADALDPGCGNGTDDDEANGDGSCDNGVDDDLDGWIDALDPDCAADEGAESGFSLGTCNNNDDDDGDGLIDALDPSCTSGYAVED